VLEDHKDEPQKSQRDPEIESSVAISETSKARESVMSER
jgi:hypothetical protein